MKHLPNLTGLRFLLASLVMFFHIPQFCENRGFPFFNALPIFNRGTEAVYLFFSLSGFLIVRILYLKKLNNGIDLWQFYKNRMLRIFPLYYLVLVFGFLYYRIILPKAGFELQDNYDLIEGILLGATLFANVLAKYSPGGILELLWSISIEEQFYIIAAPVLYYVVSKRVKLTLFVGTVLFLTLFFFQNLFPLAKWQMCFYYFSFSGLISIICLEKKVFFSNKLAKTIVFLFTGIYFFTSFVQSFVVGFNYQIVTMILFALLLGCLSVKKINVLENKVINYLGVISYGVYMFHAIIMNFVGFIFLKIIPPSIFSDEVFIVLFTTLVFGLTIIVSHFSFKYYESYFLRMKKTSLVN